MSAAIVDTFTVPDRSPPVPHVSIAPSATVDRGREAKHRAHERRELVGGLALRAQRDDEPGGLDVGDAALEDLGERRVDLVGGQLGAACEPRPGSA